MLIQTIRFIVRKLLASLKRNYLKRPTGAPLHTLSKLYDVHVGFVNPSPYFEAVYCFICCHRSVAVARYWMICLVFVVMVKVSLQQKVMITWAAKIHKK